LPVNLRDEHERPRALRRLTRFFAGGCSAFSHRPNLFKEFTVKKSILILAALAVGIILAVAFARQSAPKSLSVSEVGADPTAYTGTIVITGLTGGLSQQDPTIFGIMDLKELQCKTANCNKLLIPVKFQGQLPVLGDEVTVTGSFVKAADGLLFAAQKISVIRNHKIGG
jgi:hypothetical protein